MKVNQNISLLGQKVVLVPYRPAVTVLTVVTYREEHVQTYHQWMTDPELRELTASEPLTLEEEYGMQRKWREDEDKLTFIILARPESDNNTSTDSDSLFDAARMIGDVNLFLKGSPSTNAGNDGDGGDGEDDAEAEVEIMIAEPAYRRRGCAFEALQLFLYFATTYVPREPGTAASNSPLSSLSLRYTGSSSFGLPVAPARLVVKIGEDNAPSMAVFGRLGFEVVKRVAVFREVELRLTKPEEARERWLKGDIVETL